MNAIRTILHPTDFSENSQAALRLAASIARDQDASLVILHVVPTAAPATGAIGPRELERSERYQQELRGYQEEMRSLLNRLKVPNGSVRVEHLFKEGEVAKLILKTSEETACDLIVMGTHGKSRYLRLMLGSVAEEVSRKATCPVMTVRMPAEKPALATANA